MYSALRKANLLAGDFAVFPGGGGGVGLQGVQLASIMGFRPIVIDTGADRRELCLKRGAEAFIDFKEVKDVAAEVVRICDGIGAHGIFVTAPAAYKYALDCVGDRVGATLMCIGLRKLDALAAGNRASANASIAPAGSTFLSAEPLTFVRKNLSIRGSLVSSRAETAKVLQFAARGVLQPIHTAVYPIDKLPEAVQKIRHGDATGRSVVDFNL